MILSKNDNILHKLNKNAISCKKASKYTPLMPKLSSVLDQWPKNYVFSSDLVSLWTGSTDALFSQIKRAAKNKELIRLKKGFYLIASKLSYEKPNLFELAGLLYGPSYISFESALSYHGWILEAVYLTTCATSKRSSHIHSSIGSFSFFHIPIDAFPIGVSTSDQDGAHYLIASPWKAIADLIYVKNRHWKNINQLVTDLRIEMDSIQNADLLLLEELVHHYPSKKVRSALKKLHNNLKL